MRSKSLRHIAFATAVAAASLVCLAGAPPVTVVKSPTLSHTTPPFNLNPPPLSLTNVTVAPMGSVNSGAGESQSVVVPPGANPGSCPNGRILMDNDYTLANAVESGMTNGTIVFGHDLDPASTQVYTSTFDPPWPKDPVKAAHRWHIGQDHQYVLLPQGKVLLIAVGESDDPQHVVYPKGGPDWGPYSFAIGPDGKPAHHYERTTIYVWRSDDCGQTFKWITEVDPANDLGVNVEPALTVEKHGAIKPQYQTPVFSHIPGDGACAMPQTANVWYLDPQGYIVQHSADGTPLRDKNNNFIPNTASTPNVTFAGYNQGGTDGPSAFYDDRTGSIYLHYQCVGQEYQAIAGQPFGLGNYLNRNRMYVSKDDGAHWYAAGDFAPRAWRGSIAPFGANELAFFGVEDSAAVFASEGPNGALSPAGTSTTFPFSTGWGVNTYFAKDTGCAYSNVESSEFAMRGPKVAGRDTLLVTYPSTTQTLAPGQVKIGGATTVNWGYGQDLVVYDPVANTMLQLPPVAPQSHSPNDFVFDMAAIDPGDGPILLYWLDVNVASHRGVVWGRFVEDGGAVSPDFVISQTLDATGKPAEYAQTLSCPASFFGDYRTAGAFATTGPLATFFSYFPAWVEPSQSALRFTRITLKAPRVFKGGTLGPMLGVVPPLTAWKIAPARARYIDIARHTAVVRQDPERTEEDARKPR